MRARYDDGGPDVSIPSIPAICEDVAEILGQYGVPQELCDQIDKLLLNWCESEIEEEAK